MARVRQAEPRGTETQATRRVERPFSCEQFPNKVSDVGIRADSQRDFHYGKHGNAMTTQGLQPGNRRSWVEKLNQHWRICGW